MENFWKSSLEPSNFVQITLQKDFQCAQIEDHAPLRGEILKTILFILKSSFPRTITFGESSFGWINQMNNQALEQEVGKIVKKNHMQFRKICFPGRAIRSISNNFGTNHDWVKGNLFKWKSTSFSKMKWKRNRNV